MKKYIRMVIVLLCFLPLFVSASTLNEGKASAGNYITKFENYKKYIHIPSDSKYYAYEESGYNSTNGNGFKNGGFISSFEYNLSLDNNLSWLSPGIGYWTLSKKGDNEYYYIADKLYSKSEDSTSNVRVTEYVANTSKVRGSGTVSNPWYFVDTFRVRLRSNNENYGNLGTGSDLGAKDLYIEKGSSKTISFTAQPGYTISSTNLTDCSKDYFEIGSDKLTIKSLDRDISCVINFEPKSYAITLNPNGGTLTGSSKKSVAYESAYGSLPTATKTGYTFDGWYTEEVNGDKIDSSSILDTIGDKTLYAHWTANSYTITFNGNGGTPSYSSKTVVYATKYGDLPTASRSGYTFSGWYTSASGGVKITNDYIFKVGSNQILYAHWTVSAVTVTYVYSNGQANTTKTINYGENYTLPTDVTTPSCNSLAGWYDESGNLITNSTKMTKTTAHTITAKWNSATVTATASNIKNYFSYTGNYTILTDSGGWYIKFLTSGTLKMNACMNVDISLVGGGGGGGAGYNQVNCCAGGAGGSAGYTANYSNVLLKNQTYEITIGQGGSGAAANTAKYGGTGGTTYFGSYTAAGGGGSFVGSAGSNGGSGGGASGNGIGSHPSNYYVQGGTGGSNGSNGASTGNGGGGGQGTSTYGFASTTYPLFSGGGGGGTLYSGVYMYGYWFAAQTGGYGGNGGGARGGGSDTGQNGTSAAANTGGGGGGGGCSAYGFGSGGNGGSGIALMRNKR